MSSLLDPLRTQLAAERMITFSVRVHPGAKENRLRGFMSDGTLKIDIKAPAEDGKANVAFIGFLAQEFVVPRENVELMSGPLSRLKVIKITSH